MARKPKNKRRYKDESNVAASHGVTASSKGKRLKQNRPFVSRLRRHRDYLGAAIAALLVVLPLFGTDEVYIGSGTDMVSLEYPFHAFASQWMGLGVLPLWNPFIFGGVPFQAGVHGYLYPGWWTGLFFSVGLSIKLGMLIHMVIAATGGVFFARRRVTSRIASFVTGIAYGLSAFTVLHYFAGHPVMVATAAYLPWIAGSIDRALSGSVRDLFRGALLCGLMLLCGHYQVVFIGMGGLLLFFLIESVVVRKAIRGRNALRAAVCWGLVFISGMLVSAVQVLPMFHTLGLSQRTGGGAEFAASFSSAPANLLTYLFPNLFGNKVEAAFIGDWAYWESLGYIGVVPLMLFFVGVVVLPWRRYLAAVIVAAGALVISLGAHTPVFELYLRVVPGAELFRSPGRFCILVTLLMSLVAGMGLDTWIRGGLTKRRKWMVGIGVCVFSAGLVGVTAVLSSWDWQVFKEWAEPFASPRRIARLDAAGWGAILALAKADAMKAMMVFAVASLMVIAGLRRPGARPILGLALAALLFYELIDFAGVFLQTAPRQRLEMPRAIARILREEGGPGTRFIAPPRSRWQNYGSMHGVGNPGGYDTFIDGRYARYLNRAKGRPLDRYFGYEKLRRGSRLIRQLGAEFLVSHGPLTRGGNRQMAGYTWFEPYKRAGNVHVYRDKAVPPRVALAHHIEVAKDENAVYRRMENVSFNMRDTAIVEADLPKGFPAPEKKVSGSFEAAKIVRYEPNFVEIKTEAASAAVLVLSDTLHPGWRASVDGQVVPMVHANRVMRALPVPKGSHTVTMRYLPVAFVMGAIVSVLSLLAWMVGFVATRR